ncbi:MAG: hypothetical protein ABFE07_03740 [Armatimonadia bacterium]
MRKYIWLAVLTVSAAQAAGLRFVDQWERDGLPVVPTNILNLYAQPPEKFAALPADAPAQRYTLCWPIGAGQAAAAPDKDRWMSFMMDADPAHQEFLWVDTNRNWVFEPGEKYALGDLKWGDKTIRGFETPISTGGEPATRTLRVWLGTFPGTLLVSLRGYCAGTVELGGREVAALLADADMDGRFATLGRDLIFLDLDGNGKYFIATERYPLAEKLRLDGKTYAMQYSPNGASVAATETYLGQGMVRFALKGAGNKPVMATLRRDDGEVVAAGKLGEPVTVPEGTWTMFTLASLRIQEGARTWSYSFSRHSGELPNLSPLVVKPGQETTFDLLGPIKLTMNGVQAAAKPGDQVNAQVGFTSATGMDVRSQSSGPSTRDSDEPKLELKLLDGKFAVRAQGRMGFG